MQPSLGLIIGRRVREIRESKGWRLAATSKAAGMSESTLSKLERGGTPVSISHVERLAVALGVDTSALLCGVTRRVAK